MLVLRKPQRQKLKPREVNDRFAARSFPVLHSRSVVVASRSLARLSSGKLSVPREIGYSDSKTIDMTQNLTLLDADS